MENPEAGSWDVAVIGAGPAGLALACDLARRGVRTLLAERGADLFPGSRGKGVQPRTLEVLDDLGVAGGMLAGGGPPPLGLLWADGRPRGEHRMFDDPVVTETEPYGGPWLVPQWRTTRLLRDRLAALGGSVTYGRELTGLDQDADGVTLRFAGRSAPVRAAYVVGTDGGRSTVRRLLGIGMTGETVDPRPMLVADLRIADGALDREHWHIFPGDEETGFATACPLPATDVFQFVAQLPAGTTVDPGPAAVRALMAERTHVAAGEVEDVRWASDFTVRAALADRFRSGRVFLAGDAAHVHSPAGGQGLNTSVQDVYNLGWKLGAVLTQGAPAALLDTYEQERLPNAAAMLGLSTRIHRGEARRGKETRQLGLHYRESPLSRDALPAGAPLRAGDRAPDGRPGGVRLFDAFRGPHWTLLAVAAPAPSGLPPYVRAVEVPSCAPYGDGLFLVRPDGYVAWAGTAGTGETELRAWLKEWLAA